MPKKKEENASEDELIAPVLLTNVLLGAIEKLNKAVDKLTDKLDTPKLEMSKESSNTSPELTNIEQFYPVPSEYIDLLNTTLNKEFKVTVNPLSDSPAFQFTVLVPDKYSTISEEYRKMYKHDIRPKVITYTEGVIGVRDWLMRVFNSFNPTMQALIVADRTK